MQQLSDGVFKVSPHAIFNWRLCLRKIDGSIKFLVKDNGQGFTLAKAICLESTRLGLGLANMKERIELSGGSFVIESIEG